METDPVFACNIENNDQIAIDGKHVGYVYMVEDDGDFILLDVVDEDGEHTQYPFGPFDTVNVITRFEDDVDVEEFDLAE